MIKSMRDDPDSAALLASASRQGVIADGAVPAFQGLYPAFRGATNVGMVATRQRALTFHGDVMRAWGRFTGMQITTPKGRFNRGDIAMKLGRRNYLRLVVDDGPKFWVDASWEEGLSAWLDEGVVDPSAPSSD